VTADLDLGLAKPRGRTRVVVAMSGGVDSSVAAGLLARAGYGVVGITLRLYDAPGGGARGTCCAGRDIEDARAVAAALDVPHYVLDYADRFRREVIEDFAETYARGLTPIPCVRCNQRVKFRDLLGFARDLGADALATGHYVRRIEGPEGPELHRAADPARDQSYFLFATTRDELAFLRFPLGAMRKERTRALARELGLPVATKPDSQDICFVPDGRPADLVKRLRPEAGRPGEIVDARGRVLGRHGGIAGFTVGQRKGLGVAGPEPLYVLALDAANARVVVGTRAEARGTRLTIGEVNWLSSTSPGEDGMAVAVKLRSTQTPIAARVRVLPDGRMAVALADADLAIAPGQACVIYAGERVLGGGWIEKGPPSLTAPPPAPYIEPFPRAAE
jgi:tRNA-specific 2-thiouridylase